MDETKLFWIKADRYDNDFPPLEHALTDPDGLLAAGGELSVERLLSAYSQGIFPWFDDNQPILWWSPSPRTVLVPGQAHVSRSLKKVLNRNEFTLTFDQCFETVMHECAAPRGDDQGTWITEDMIHAYAQLHQQNHAHSIECWKDSKLVGGLYGVSIGKVFFGESMFSRVSNASKVCLVSLSTYLEKWGFILMDCQVESDHLSRMGTVQISREVFQNQLRENCIQQPDKTAWSIK